MSKLLTKSEVAARIRCSVSWLEQLVALGEFPGPTYLRPAPKRPKPFWDERTVERHLAENGPRGRRRAPAAAG